MGNMKLTLEIWRQKNAQSQGGFETIQATDISPDMSFLEMLDVVNDQLIKQNKEPIAFDSDCREGICGSCGLFINGQAHGPKRAMTTCQLHMRTFKDGDTIVIEPWRAKSFPVIKDLVVDRGAFDKIIQSGGYISAKTGPHPDANAHLIPKPVADKAMAAATCIGCGACVAACPNASAHLFLSAKVSQFALLPQGQPERMTRVKAMVEKHDDQGFGSCTNIGECQAACPKEINISFIAMMRRDYLSAALEPAPTESKDSE